MRLRKFRPSACAGILFVLSSVGQLVPDALAAERDAAAKSSPSGGSPGAPRGDAGLAAAKSNALPPGHPNVEPTDDDDDGDLPAGHPPTGASEPEQNRLPEDQSEVDKQLPAGTIVVEIRDGADRPVPRTDMTLGILQQSVAKGESRRKVPKQADDAGTVRFDGLEFGGGVAYRVTVPWGTTDGGGGATYAAPPFQLDLHHGQRVRVHVFPASNNVADTMLGMDGVVYMELKDDAIQFDEVYRVYNLGAVTWVPNDVVITLPPGFKAFLSQQEMSDTGFDEAPGRGAKLRGTFGPGQHEVKFRYQIPYGGDDSIAFTTSLPPHVARMRVIAEASRGMTLHVADFPDAVTDRNNSGQRVVVTEHQLRAGEKPPSQLRIALDNIPTEGSAKWVATALAAATVLLGLYLAFQQEKSKTKSTTRVGDEEAERARTRLVAEIAELDKARSSGELGPQAYDRIRAVLLDALARLMAVQGPSSST